MQVAATPMPTWRALAVSSAIGTPVVVSTYISVNNNFSNKKFFFFPSKGRVCYGIPQQFRIHLFQHLDPLNFVRPINQFRQTHQSTSSDPSINFSRPINFVRTINFVRLCSKFCEPI
jgi:hypothetical protein